MSVILSVEDTGPCRKRLEIEVPAEAVAAASREVVRELGRRTSLPGFRKGKVPESVVRRRFQDEIREEVVERLVPRYWELAREEGGLDPLAAPQVEEVGELSADEALVFFAVVEVRPEIELGDLAGVELPDPPVEPGEQEISDALDELRRRVAPWTAAERPAGRGDRVQAAITEITAGGPAPDPDAGESEDPEAAGDAGDVAGEVAADGAPETDPETAAADQAGEPEPQTVTVEIGDPSVWEELSLALSGLEPGQEARFTRRPEEGGEARTFRVAVEQVEERELPPLDDELAAKLGDFDSVEALRTTVVEQLTAGKRDARRRQRRDALLAELRQRHPLALPQGVVDHEVEHMLRDYAMELSQRGVDVENQVDWRNAAGQARPEAERRVHDRLLLDAAAEREGMAVEESELVAAVTMLARARRENPAELRRALESSGRLEGLRSQLRRDKTVRRLLGEEPTETADAGAESADAVAATSPGGDD